MKTKKTIGRADIVDFPDLGIEGVKAKIDTGAFTSSIHCKKISVKEGVLSFHVSIDQNGTTISKRFETTDYTQKKIRSSNGVAQLRYVIKTKIVLFGKAYPAQFSLTDRSRMKNPVLLGRKLLKGRFLVDVSEKNLSFDLKKTQK